MTSITYEKSNESKEVVDSTKEWGDWHSVSRYLERCRVDTPFNLVTAVWAHVTKLRRSVRKVLDFGAGDGRFSKTGRYCEYLGYEIDSSRYNSTDLPTNATILNKCAFLDNISDADLCIGNPPYVRNQYLPSQWRRMVSDTLVRRTGTSFSGLANAWQYFFVLSLISTNQNGLCALIIPYEWVSRPSAKALRDYIHSNKWNVKVYRLLDSTFPNVLTTSSITFVDKRKLDDSWSYYAESPRGKFTILDSPSGSAFGVLPYIKKRVIPNDAPVAKRGLSPGTQKVLTLSEGERIHNGLIVGTDVVPCVTTLRPISNKLREFDTTTFSRCYRDAGRKCWLIRTDVDPSPALQGYLDSISPSSYQTTTCKQRRVWWKFNMPEIPMLLFAQAFTGFFPKVVRNLVNARAVGGVCGIYNLDEDQSSRMLSVLCDIDLTGRIVSHSNGFKKVEINQINTLLVQKFETTSHPGIH